MKKVLLATSALTLSAGFASADVSMSGTGGAGVFGANGADLSVYSGVDLGFALSGASDNGMTFSASLDMGGGQTLDVGDFELDTQDMGTDDNVSVAIGVSGVTITLSQDGVDDLYDDDIAGDIGVSGAMGDLTYSVVTGLEDADPTSLSIGYSAGAISGSVATSDEGDASTVTVSYAMGDITVSAESDTDRTGADTSSITISYAMSDGMTISLENSEDVNEVSVSYASGAISVGLTADDAATESWEATMAYDLGGGATFNLGTNQDETTFAGVGFSF
jgi:outer membrane protein OmpU|tara:strand:- start:218 stop:1048 length:831 start_codon:yes stop_codon:yes gene_type:complete